MKNLVLALALALCASAAQAKDIWFDGDLYRIDRDGYAFVKIAHNDLEPPSRWIALPGRYRPIRYKGRRYLANPETGHKIPLSGGFSRDWGRPTGE